MYTIGLTMTRFVIVTLLGASAAAFGALADGPLPNHARQAELIHMLRHDCGSCHGMRLEGGLGPALNPTRFQHWTVDQIALTILHGRPGSPMPPWRPFLSDGDARWLASQLKQGVGQ